jgi:hypothetical protein
VVLKASLGAMDGGIAPRWMVSGKILARDTVSRDVGAAALTEV